MARSVVVAAGGGGGWDGGAMGAIGAMVSSIIQCGRIPVNANSFRNASAFLLFRRVRRVSALVAKLASN